MYQESTEELQRMHALEHACNGTEGACHLNDQDLVSVQCEYCIMHIVHVHVHVYTVYMHCTVCVHVYYN